MSYTLWLMHSPCPELQFSGTRLGTEGSFSVSQVHLGCSGYAAAGVPLLLVTPPLLSSSVPKLLHKSSPAKSWIVNDVSVHLLDLTVSNCSGYEAHVRTTFQASFYSHP